MDFASAVQTLSQRLLSLHSAMGRRHESRVHALLPKIVDNFGTLDESVRPGSVRYPLGSSKRLPAVRDLAFGAVGALDCPQLTHAVQGIRERLPNSLALPPYEGGMPDWQVWGREPAWAGRGASPLTPVQEMSPRTSLDEDDIPLLSRGTSYESASLPPTPGRASATSNAATPPNASQQGTVSSTPVRRKLDTLELGSIVEGHKELRPVKLSIVTCASSGRRYLVGNPMRIGHFGKVSPAVELCTGTDPEQLAELLVLKKVHFFRKPSAVTEEMSEANIDKEIRILRLLGDVKDVVRDPDAGRVYIVMKKMEDEVYAVLPSMDDVRRVDAARHAIAQMADNLALLHAHNIIHKDVKFDNALHSRDGVVKICDPGLADDLDPIDNCAPSNTAGTPHLMAPEVWRNERLSTGVDAFSLGMGFAEAHTAVDSPFFRCPGLETPRCVDAHLREHARLSKWRSRLVKGQDAEGRDIIDLSLIRGSDQPKQTAWDAYWYPVSIHDPQGCSFVLSCMIHPDAARRAKMTDITSAWHNLLPDPEKEPQRHADMLSAWDKPNADSAYERLIDLLQQVRKQLLRG